LTRPEASGGASQAAVTGKTDLMDEPKPSGKTFSELLSGQSFLPSSLGANFPRATLTRRPDWVDKNGGPPARLVEICKAGAHPPLILKRGPPR